MKPFSQECLGPQIPFSSLHRLESNVTEVKMNCHCFHRLWNAKCESWLSFQSPGCKVQVHQHLFPPQMIIMLSIEGTGQEQRLGGATFCFCSPTYAILSHWWNTVIIFFIIFSNSTVILMATIITIIILTILLINTNMIMIILIIVDKFGFWLPWIIVSNFLIVKSRIRLSLPPSLREEDSNYRRPVLIHM